MLTINRSPAVKKLQEEISFSSVFKCILRDGKNLVLQFRICTYYDACQGVTVMKKNNGTCQMKWHHSVIQSFISQHLLMPAISADMNMNMTFVFI